MLTIDRFFACDTEKPERLQPDCPVYLHCFRRNVERSTCAQFLQVRLVNRSERTVETVILSVEGIAADGTRRYLLPELILAKCNAAPHSVFGEDRLLALTQKPVKSLSIAVEQVLFSDGMVWRRRDGHSFINASQWRQCPACAMRNPPEAARCSLCGGSLVQPELPKVEFDPPTPPERPVRPAPIVRAQPVILPTDAEEDDFEDNSVPSWLVVLFCILGTVALFVLAALVLRFLEQNF